MSFKRLHLTHRASSALWKHALLHTLTLTYMSKVYIAGTFIELVFHCRTKFAWMISLLRVNSHHHKIEDLIPVLELLLFTFFFALFDLLLVLCVFAARCCCQWPDCVLFATAAAHLYSHSVDGWTSKLNAVVIYIRELLRRISFGLPIFFSRSIYIGVFAFVCARVPHF